MQHLQETGGRVNQRRSCGCRTQSDRLVLGFAIRQRCQIEAQDAFGTKSRPRRESYPLVRTLDCSQCWGLRSRAGIEHKFDGGCKIAPVRGTRWGSKKSQIMTADTGMRADTRGGQPTMNAGTRQILQLAEQAQKRIHSNGSGRTSTPVGGPKGGIEARPNVRAAVGQKPRVFVAAENRLLREALSRMLLKSGQVEVVGTDLAESFHTDDLLREEADILLLSSRGNRNEDLNAVRRVRTTAPKVQILLIGVAGGEAEFLQCVRAGVHGYLPKEASAEDVVEGVRALQGGEAICPGLLCATLFRYLEREATSFPSASVHLRLGLTLREQQLIPLIAEGLTNKEIANRFCLSEQTVKNHLYRMKHKIGAEDRLGIVQVCRTHGFMP